VCEMAQFKINLSAVRFITTQNSVAKRCGMRPNTTTCEGPDGSGSFMVISGVLVNSSFKRAMETERRLDGGPKFHV
jgi:hypothetical protein